jgi:hypothetical protein
MQRGVAVIKRHLETQEAGRRYKSSWVIGGYAIPVLNEILRVGGLWVPRHKAWAPPDRGSWQQIQVLLPGDF